MDENNFFSIDRLVEFGISMAVATQMVNSMNTALQRMVVPGVDNASRLIPGESAAQVVYYVVLNDRAVGPLSAAELQRLINEGRVSKETYVWKPGMPNWQLAENVPDVLGLVSLTPPPVPKQQLQTGGE